MLMVPPTSAHRIGPAEPSASMSHATNSPAPSQAFTITAPAPSPKSTAVLRSVQSVIRDNESAPITRIVSRPMAIIP